MIIKVNNCEVMATPYQLQKILHNKLYALYYRSPESMLNTLQLRLAVFYYYNHILYDWTIIINESDYITLSSLIPRKTMYHVGTTWYEFNSVIGRMI